ncbi:hypothetical protein LINGRAHAP2_LOCUS29582 [Linum grandiflorum]
MTWIRLLDLPLHFFNKIAVERIAGLVGHSVRADVSTTTRERTRYACACVDLDLSKPLLGKYELGNKEYEIVYESLAMICTRCGLYGHVSDQ